MKRLPLKPRADALRHLEQAGCPFAVLKHGSSPGPYLSEVTADPVVYTFTEKEHTTILRATKELHHLALEVVDHACRHHEAMNLLRLPENYLGLIRQSWFRNDPDLYQRMDLIFDKRDKQYKMAEYNGDTPTGIAEMMANAHWFNEARAQGIIPTGATLGNQLYPALVERFRRLKFQFPLCSFAALKDVLEEETTVKHLQNAALEAGIEASYLHLGDIGTTDCDELIDAHGNIIPALFKLYPWEDIATGPYSQAVRNNHNTRFLEPAWKMIWSNKGFLVLAWHMFPGHPNLLPAYWEGDPRIEELSNAIWKPQYGREGSNMAIYNNKSEEVLITPGPYGDDNYVVQDLAWTEKINGHFLSIGSWVVDNQPVGLFLREDQGPITSPAAINVPYYIEG